MKMIEKNRKTKVFLFSVAVAVGCAFFVPINTFQPILDFLLYLAIAFFTSNTLTKVPGMQRYDSEKNSSSNSDN